MNYLIIGICTVSTRAKSYLNETVNSLIENLHTVDGKNVKIVIFDCDVTAEVSTSIKQLKKTFQSQINEGLIEIVRTEDKDYPDLANLPTAFGDSKERTFWRTKQCIDYGLIFKYCYGKSLYYLHLEDDVLSVPNYFQKICYEIERFQDKKWAAMQFCNLGFIGMLFKNEDLNKISTFFRNFCDEMPVDWLIEYFFALRKRKGEAFICAERGFFQHIGYQSSLENKTSDLQSAIFNQATYHDFMEQSQFTRLLSRLLTLGRKQYIKIKFYTKKILLLNKLQ